MGKWPILRNIHKNSTAALQLAAVCSCSLLSLRLITAEEKRAKGKRGQANVYTSLSA